MPILAVLVLTNPMCYTFGRFLRERHKPAFYDSAVSFVHPVTTFFPYANAGELFVWLGVATVSEARAVDRPARDAVLRRRHRGHPHPWRLTELITGYLIRREGKTEVFDRFDAEYAAAAAGGAKMTTTDDTSGGRTFRSVFVRAGRGGWGRGLELTPTPDKYKVISVTGGGIHPVAQRIAELSGGEAVDGFRTKVEDAETLAAVINCGGTARIGVYPRKRIPTVDVFPGEPGGPLAQFITEDIFVSAVGTGDVSLLEGQTVGAGTAAGAAAMAGAGGAAAAAGHWPVTEEEAEEGGRNAGPLAPLPEEEAPSRAPKGFFVKFGTGVGYIINTFLAAARQSINLTLNTVLPFMAYVSLLLGFVIYTGIAEWIGEPARAPEQQPDRAGRHRFRRGTAVPVTHPRARRCGRPDRRCPDGHPDRDRGAAGAIRPAHPVRHRRPGRLRLHPGRTRPRRGQGRDRRGRHAGRAVQSNDHLTARRRHRLGRQLRPVGLPLSVPRGCSSGPVRTGHPGHLDLEMQLP